MNNLTNNTTDLSLEEMKSINGGDGLTRAFFRLLGWCSVILEAGLDIPDREGVAGSRPFE